MQITDKWIKDNNPCGEALQWWDRKERDSVKILNKLLRAKKYEWANWFVVRTMTYKQYVSYAVYAAEQVIHIYEKKYPDDNRPRKAIDAARKCIDDPSDENKKAAAGAAKAAWAAGAAKAAEAAWAAWAAKAAWAAEAAWAAKAVEAASWAAAGAAWAARKKLQVKILKYGMNLLEIK